VDDQPEQAEGRKKGLQALDHAGESGRRYGRTLPTAWLRGR